METKENAIMNDTELEQVKGGGAASIHYYIEIGNEFVARRIFREEKNELSDSEKKRIRRAFYDKFGYEID